MSDHPTPKFPLYHLPPQAIATIILALADYLERRTAEEKETLPRVRTCETPFGTVQPYDAAQVLPLIRSLEHTGLNFSEIVPLFAERAEDSPYVAAAQQLVEEGKFEVDDPAVVSHGGDAGAYVMGWVWVSDEAAGIADDGDSDEQFYTIQLGSDPDQTLWYFDDEDDAAKAAQHVTMRGQLMYQAVVDELPDDEDIADLDEFKVWVDTFAHWNKTESR
jgi:hypothetical protein